MELTREHFRAIVLYNFRRGLSRQECVDELKTLFGNKVPSYSTVRNWFNEFNCGRRLLKDKFLEGRLKTGLVSENIDAVRELIMQISSLLTGQNIELMGLPPYSPDLKPKDFFLFPHIIKCVVNDFRHQKILLKCSKTMFWRYLNRSAKTNTNADRTSKHSEYRYAKKC